MKRLVLIDGHALVFRAYYSYPASLTTPGGEQINAVYGFINILLSILKKLKPTHVAVAFDLDKPTFRHIDYVGYKAQRPEVDQELKDQLDRVKEAVKVLNIPFFEVEGFEGDDVIGTLALQASRSSGEVIIVTGDQDAMQLVNGSVKVFVPGRGQKPAVIFGIKEVKRKYDLKPKQIIDLKGLVGDVSDNIPGIKGIGPKIATKLLNKFGNVEGIYKHLDKAMKRGEIKPAVAKKLIDNYQEAIRSKKLATIVTDVPITLKWKQCRLHDYNKTKVTRLFEEWGFDSLIKRLPNDDWEEGVEKVFNKLENSKQLKTTQKNAEKSNQIGLF